MSPIHLVILSLCLSTTLALRLLAKVLRVAAVVVHVVTPPLPAKLRTVHIPLRAGSLLAALRSLIRNGTRTGPIHRPTAIIPIEPLAAQIALLDTGTRLRPGITRGQVLSARRTPESVKLSRRTLRLLASISRATK